MNFAKGTTAMNEKNDNYPPHRDVIQRYCPKRGENVIMLRTYGETPSLRCCGYESCRYDKDDFCRGGERGVKG